MIQVDLENKTTLTQHAPAQPGVYLFLNSDQKVIYVGKSKNLKRRLSQYVHAKRLKKHRKMRKILSEAASVQIETCETELRAELLETRLIQRLRPKWNIAGAFHFMYPMIGIQERQDTFLICYTTQPELLPEFEFHGAYRSRHITREAFFALSELLRYVGHEVRQKRTAANLRPKYSSIFHFRQIPQEWREEWSAFFRGESKQALETLVFALLENAGARRRSHETQEEIRKILRFWRWEAVPLFKARTQSNYPAYPVAQTERDILFLKHRAALLQKTSAQKSKN
jgi:excinuclease UvrABC nuclease subunit